MINELSTEDFHLKNFDHTSPSPQQSQHLPTLSNPQITNTPLSKEPHPIKSNLSDVLSNCNDLFKQIHGLYDLRQTDMPSSEYASQWISLTEELVKEVHNLQKAAVEEQKKFDKGKAINAEKDIQNQMDTERNHPESSAAREKVDDLNVPPQDSLRDDQATQQFLRNPFYEDDIRRIEAKVDKFVGLMEEVNANQKNIMTTLASLCSQPQP